MYPSVAHIIIIILINTYNNAETTKCKSNKWSIKPIARFAVPMRFEDIFSTRWNHETSKMK